MIPPRLLSDAVWTSGSLEPGDVPDLAEAGFEVLVNNRPDGEAPGQASSAEIEAAASALGLRYVHAPIAGFPGPDAVSQVGEALAGGGKTLLFCKSGMRSAAAWALAVSQTGAMDQDEILTAGRGAGFDLSGLPL